MNIRKHPLLLILSGLFFISLDAGKVIIDSIEVIKWEGKGTLSITDDVGAQVDLKENFDKEYKKNEPLEVGFYSKNAQGLHEGFCKNVVFVSENNRNRHCVKITIAPFTTAGPRLEIATIDSFPENPFVMYYRGFAFPDNDSDDIHLKIMVSGAWVEVSKV